MSRLSATRAVSFFLRAVKRTLLCIAETASFTAHKDSFTDPPSIKTPSALPEKHFSIPKPLLDR
jgi:hypothetical protein